MRMTFVDYTHFFFIFIDIFTVKRRLRDYRREMGSRTGTEFEPGLKGSSGRVVITAIVMYVHQYIHILQKMTFVFSCFVLQKRNKFCI